MASTSTTRRTSRSSHTSVTRPAAAIAVTSIRPSRAAPRAEARHVPACNGLRVTAHGRGTPAPAGVRSYRALKAAAFVSALGFACLAAVAASAIVTDGRGVDALAVARA